MAKAKEAPAPASVWRTLDERDGFATECMRGEGGAWIYRLAQYKGRKDKRRLVAVQPLGISQARAGAERSVEMLHG